MIKSNNLKNFGSAAKALRESLGYSRYFVNEKTGIKRDTLARIENGESIPRYDTLDSLSVLYKVNMHLLFESKREINDINDFYRYADNLITNFDTDSISRLNDLYDDFAEKNKLSKQVFSDEDLVRFKQIINLITIFYSVKKDDYIHEIEQTLSILGSTDCNLDDILTKKHFDPIEYRLIILLSSFYKQNKQVELAIKTLEVITERLNDVYFYDETILHMHIKAIFNLSYLYFIKGQHQDTLSMADKGINLLSRKHSNYLLAQLRARRCVAYIRLGYPIEEINSEYLHTLFSLSLEGSTQLLETYIKIFSERYNLEIDANTKMALLKK